MKPTRETYSQLGKAYAHFNRTLFAGRLPNCLITLARKKGARGYFWGDVWKEATGEQLTDEIALNPDCSQRPLREVLSTLVHEMCHLEQHHCGAPSRSGYHNKEWAEMMEAVGLMPSTTGEPGGKKTGQRVTHYIIAGGRFDAACEKLLDAGFQIPWQARTIDEAAAKKKRASKTKYSCPACDLNAWAKPDALLKCGECDELMEAETN